MNVLVLIVDSLRQDYCLSNKTVTPSLDDLQKDSVTFDRAISGASWTAPSMSSIFSGIYPHRLGMYNFSESYPPGVQTLFSAVENSGYEVGSFVFNDDVLFRNVPSANVIDDFRDYDKPEQWIINHTDDDFFLFIHHLWVHSPYEIPDSPEDWMHMNAEIHKDLRTNHSNAKSEYKEKYIEAIERMDKNWLRRLIETLKNNGIYEDTLIIFTSDHGESWGGRFSDKSDIKSNFHMHGKQLYDEHIRVPLIVKNPDSDIGDEKVKEQVRHVDIFPTVIDLLGIEANGEWDRDGRSLAPVFSGDEINSRSAISSATGSDFQTIEKFSWREVNEKLIWNIPESSIEYYDLDVDPGEVENMEQKNPKRAKKYLDCLRLEYDKIPDEPLKLTEEAKERLEDLGYR